MAVKVELPLEMLRPMFTGRISLLNRQRNLATNAIIQDALAKEIAVLTTAMNTAHELPPEKNK